MLDATKPASDGKRDVRLELWPKDDSSTGEDLAAVLQQNLTTFTSGSSEDPAVACSEASTSQVPLLEEDLKGIANAICSELSREPPVLENDSSSEVFGAPGGFNEMELRAAVKGEEFSRHLLDELNRDCCASGHDGEFFAGVVVPEDGVSCIDDPHALALSVAIRPVEPMAPQALDLKARSIFAEAFRRAVQRTGGPGAWWTRPHLCSVDFSQPASVNHELGARYFVEVPPKQPVSEEGPEVAGGDAVDEELRMERIRSRRQWERDDAAKARGGGKGEGEGQGAKEGEGARHEGSGPASAEDVAAKLARAMDTLPGHWLPKSPFRRSDGAVDAMAVGTLESARHFAFRFVDLKLTWSYPVHGKDFLDATSLVFAGDRLVQVVDYRAGAGEHGQWGALSIADDGVSLRQCSRNDSVVDPTLLDVYPFDSESSSAEDHRREHAICDAEKAPESSVPEEPDSEEADEAEKKDAEWLDDFEAKQEMEECGQLEILPGGRRNLDYWSPRKVNPGCPRCKRRGKSCKMHRQKPCEACRSKRLCIIHCQVCQRRRNRDMMKEQYPREVRYHWGAVRAAVRHSGDVMDDSAKTGQHKMLADLSRLPESVNDMFFTLSAYKCDDLSLFPQPAVRVVNALFPEHHLTEYKLERAGTSQAVVMCALSRLQGQWIVEPIGATSKGNVLDYTPLIQSTRERLRTRGL